MQVCPELFLSTLSYTFEKSRNATSMASRFLAISNWPSNTNSSNWSLHPMCFRKPASYCSCICGYHVCPSPEPRAHPVQARLCFQIWYHQHKLQMMTTTSASQVLSSNNRCKYSTYTPGCHHLYTPWAGCAQTHNMVAHIIYNMWRYVIVHVQVHMCVCVCVCVCVFLHTYVYYTTLLWSFATMVFCNLHCTHNSARWSMLLPPCDSCQLW